MNYRRGDIDVEPTQLLINIATAEGSQSGLLHTSAVKCEHVITLHRRFIDRVIGRLPPDFMRKVGVQENAKGKGPC